MNCRVRVHSYFPPSLFQRYTIPLSISCMFGLFDFA